MSTENEKELLELKVAIQTNLSLSDEAMNYYFIHDSTVNQTYVLGDGNIRICFKNGEIKEITQVEHTLISEALLVPIKKHYICHPRLNR